MTFLPDNYSGIPNSQTNYMRFENGENRVRILSAAIIGYEYWIAGGDKSRKPVRVKTWEQVPSSAKHPADKRDQPTYFWAFVVYNYQTRQIQILELRQATIMRQIEALVDNKKWGDPKEYDIVINKIKTGSEKWDIEYSVMPDPKEPVDPGIKQLYRDMNIKLNALYEGKNPFDPEAADDLPEAGDETVDPGEIPDSVGKRSYKP